MSGIHRPYDLQHLVVLALEAAEKRRAYADAGSAKRSRILDEVCETVGYTRKYVIKLLTGNIRYKERKGRGKTCSGHALANARRLWEAVGCPCMTCVAHCAERTRGTKVS